LHFVFMDNMYGILWIPFRDGHCIYMYKYVYLKAYRSLNINTIHIISICVVILRHLYCVILDCNVHRPQLLIIIA
jgi:hypothetical protein